MVININGSEYNFRVTGTVGLVYLAERSLGAAYDHKDRYHQLMLYYCCLVVSNPGKNVPDIMEFIASLTSAAYGEIQAYFWQEWERLEGIPEHKEEDVQGED